VTQKTKLIAAIGAIAAVAIAGVAGYVIGQADDGHMGGSWMGNMPAMPVDAHHAHHGSGDNEWAGSRMQMGAMPGMSVEGGVMSMGESAFLAMMIPHHEMAVDMANDQLERGTDPQVRAMAEQVIADQRGEIAQMKNWHREWFGAAPPTMPMSGAMAMMGMSMDHDAIRGADDPDLVFVRQMIPHHAGAILMSDMLLAGDPRPELASLAQDIIAAQSAEIGQMQASVERLGP
jgi:uncharacterized protein (DUF305 family)